MPFGIDGFDVRSHGVDEKDLLISVDGGAYQVAREQPPHVRSRQISILECDLDMRCKVFLAVNLGYHDLTTVRETESCSNGLEERNLKAWISCEDIRACRFKAEDEVRRRRMLACGGSTARFSLALKARLVMLRSYDLEHRLIGRMRREKLGVDQDALFAENLVMEGQGTGLGHDTRPPTPS